MTQKILCIEPIEQEYAVMSDLFLNLGFKPVLATTDGKGIATFREQKNDISMIVLDHFPNFVEVHSTIKNLRKIDPDIPIVVLSGADLPEWYRRACIEAGCKEFLSKPVSDVYWMQILGEYTH